MGWAGALIGSFLGHGVLGPLGALIGAAIGHSVENGVKKKGHHVIDAPNANLVFCASAAAMLAKLAKADGHVTEPEIASVERSFARLGFAADVRKYAVKVFRQAKYDTHSIYDYACEFAQAVDSIEVRELFYELLWDLACADGTVGTAEMSILRNIPKALSIGTQWFWIFANERLETPPPGGPRGAFGGGASDGAGHRAPPPPKHDSLEDAYALLGVSPTATDDEVKRAYRERAKKYHPDALRAQGLPEEMLGKATDMMAKVNAAWARIREKRGIH